MADPRKPISTRILRAFEMAEDGIHILVALLLVGLAIGLVGNSIDDVVIAFRGQEQALPTVLTVLDKTLVLFIVAELLHTVRITILHRGRLDAEPFLVVGMIAAVRRVLILTAEAEVSFQWNPHGIELIIMVALIISLAAAIIILRRAKRLAD